MFLEYKFGCLGLSFVPGEKSPLLEKEMAFVHQDTFECAQKLFVNISFSLYKLSLLPVCKFGFRQAWLSIPGIVHGERSAFEEETTVGSLFLSSEFLILNELRSCSLTQLVEQISQIHQILPLLSIVHSNPLSRRRHTP